MVPDLNETIYLKTLDGFNFENLCARIIEKLGWGKVTVTPKTGDGGKDIILLNSKSETIYIECKHQPNTRIGRPVIQKLHSAVITSGASKGIVITSGSFSREASEYAKTLTPPMELVDILNLTEMAQNIGIRLVIGDDVANYFYKPYASDAVLEDIQYSLLDNLKTYPRKIKDLIKFETFQKGFLPIYIINYSIHDSFTTSVGEIGSVHEDNKWLWINGSTRNIAEQSIITFVNDNSSSLSSISNLHESAQIPDTINKSIDLVSLGDIVKQIIIDKYTREYEYVGQNNVSYKKTFYPRLNSISLKNIKKVDLRFRMIRIIQGTISKEIVSLDAENRVLLDHDIPFCDYCGKNKRLMICDSCAAVFDCGFGKHGRKCSICGKAICVNCCFKYKWPSSIRGYICEECSLKSFGKESSEKRKRKKVLEPNYWDTVKNNRTFKV